ncbi:hypothetical protein F5141DRAFT_1172607 [Pisolithus sp. B1]|nr:hypothetical protein F5141DRAFT_1172607 [Pisolithus sp. B1]
MAFASNLTAESILRLSDFYALLLGMAHVLCRRCEWVSEWESRPPQLQRAYRAPSFESYSFLVYTLSIESNGQTLQQVFISQWPESGSRNASPEMRSPPTLTFPQYRQMLPLGMSPLLQRRREMPLEDRFLGQGTSIRLAYPQVEAVKDPLQNRTWAP